MATKITITESQRNEFLRAREVHTADEAKSIRRAAWASIRAKHGIPEDIKLRVEVDLQHDPNFKVIRDKETDYPLWKMNDGRVVASPVGPIEPADEAPRGGRFATAEDGRAPEVYAIGVDSLLRLLRDGDEDPEDYVYPAVTLPAGFPGVSDSGVVLDTQDRILYFRA